MPSGFENKILEFLKKSSVPKGLKETVKKALPSLSDVRKAKVFKTLIKEQKKLTSLQNKKERIIEKYAQFMKRVAGKGE